PSLAALPRGERLRMVRDLEKEMHRAAEELRFEEAALLRDQIIELRRSLQDESNLPAWQKDSLVEIEESVSYQISREPA
ncbi:MAG: UvrB/UvrC motif-containing protein, partial [Anaerolineae bacterium]|nr:UvrB/UvrC motif-containing protein [Anaerolineae bacterium]